MKYKVTVKWVEEYEIEVEADSEQEAYDMAVDQSSDGSSYACDCYLHDVDVQEIEDDGENEEDD